MNAITRFLQTLGRLIATWWRRVRTSQGRRRAGWLLLPVVTVCGCCSIGTAILPKAPTARTAPAPTSISQADRIAIEAATPAGVVPPAAPPTAPPATLPPATPELPTSTVVSTDVPPTSVPATEVPTVAPTDVPAPTTVPPTDVPPTAVPPMLTALMASTANIRNQPSAEGGLLGQVDGGVMVKLRVHTADTSWYVVEAPSGLVGWVSAPLLSVDPAVAQAVPVGTDDPAIASEPVVAAPPAPTEAPAAAGAAPAPTEAPAAPPAGGHAFYTSSRSNARFYYCDTDAGWKSLSAKYLQKYDSPGALLRDYPGRALHRPC